MENILKNMRFLNVGVVVLCNIALILETLGSISSALDILKKAIKTAPGNSKLYLHASRLCLKKGQVDNAVLYWKKAAGSEHIGSFLYWLERYKKEIKDQVRPDKCPPGTNNHNKHSDIVADIKELNIKKQDLNDIGLELLDRGYYNEALKVFLQDLNTAKANPVLYFNVAHVLSKLGRHTRALEYYEKAQGMDFNSLELLNNKGYSLFHLKRFEEAQACYELARGLAPEDYTVLNNLAACYLKTGQQQKAKHCFAKAIKSYPTDAGLENNLGMCLELAGDAGQALNHYERAFTLETDTYMRINVLVNKINCLIRLNRLSEALNTCDEIPDKDKTFEIWGIKADLLNELGRTKEAAENYRKALGLSC